METTINYTNKRLLTAKELAEYIGSTEGSTEGSIRALKCQGKLPKQWIVPLGKRNIRFDVNEVDKSIDSAKANDFDSIFQVRA